LEGLIKEFPENPGANHYYIHAVEGSKHPERALHIANRLGNFMPGLSHLVHMPSHIYIRSGYYEKGIEVNQAAVKGYGNYVSKYPVVANASFLYLMHNLHMKAACAAMDGQYKHALQYSLETRNSFDTAYLDAGGYWSMYSQYLYMTPLFTQIRFGKWNDIIRSAEIPDERVYAKVMLHFGKGLAYARLHQFDKASDELEHMDDSLNSTQLTDHPPAFNAGIAALEVAQLILKGAIAEEQNQLPKAIGLYKEAAEKESLMLYNEPKDWLLPVNQYLGNALIKAKQFAEAEKVFKEDLKVNPNNGWALTGLQTSLQKLNKKGEATVVRQKLKTAFARRDLKISASVF
jgi:tetratricopeptide (TPR) repeat protein